MKHWTETLVPPSISIIDAIRAMDQSAAQIVLVADAERRLLGTVTDGDVRRGLLAGIELARPVTEVMRRRPTVVPPSVTRLQAISIMRHGAVRHLPVVDEQSRLLGLHSLVELLSQEQRENWVILMAGGEGTRLHPLTRERPKPMIEVGGKPILEVIIESFLEQGFRRFFVSVNFMAEVIKDYFGDGSRFGARIEYLAEDRKLGTAGCLSLLPEPPQAPFIVMNGDLLTKVNFNSLLEFHEGVSADVTMCVKEHRTEVPFGVVDVDGDRITAIREKPVESFFINAGIYVLDAGVRARIPDGEHYDMTSLFSQVLESGGRACSFPVMEYWIDIGRLSDLERANLDYLSHFA